MFEMVVLDCSEVCLCSFDFDCFKDMREPMCN